MFKPYVLYHLCDNLRIRVAKINIGPYICDLEIKDLFIQKQALCFETVLVEWVIIITLIDIIYQSIHFGKGGLRREKELKMRW